MSVTSTRTTMPLGAVWGEGGGPGRGRDRAAAVARSLPCLTTVQALAPAVQGIDALHHGDVGVRSLQEHAGLLTAADRDQCGAVGVEVSTASATASAPSAVPIR